ncbi:MAG: dienelactone hydrolase family protein [Alphaproteobacteria bacterium]|nr:dienelactone hydrolase family protein [Alphaproteobacteria bacterium]
MSLRAAIRAITLLLAGAVPVSAQDAPIWSRVEIPVVAVPDAVPARRPLPARLALPSGPGPFAAVVVLHTCSGVSQHTNDWAARLVGWGYAALAPDSFGPRNVGDVCRSLGSVTPFDRAGDAVAAALYLRTLPQIAGDAIGVIGFSHGGGGAGAVTRATIAERYPGLIKASVNYYGGCNGTEARRVVPLLVLIGGADDWASAKVCAEFARRVQATPPVELMTYPGVAHFFDNPSAHGVNAVGHVVEYDAAAADDSFARTRAFFDRWLRRPPPA